MHFTTLLTEVDHAIGIITLTRPDRHNAYDDTLRDELIAALGALADDPRVRVVVLSATGKSFCAGSEGDWLHHALAADGAEQQRDATLLAELLYQLDRFPKPTVVRVQGPAYGPGLGLVAACDIAIATFDAQFALAEARQGLLAAEVAPYLANAVGSRHARRYLLTAARFAAAEAYRLGLVHEIVADEALLDEAVGEVIDQLLRSAPGAQTAGKKLLHQVRQPDEDWRAVSVAAAMAQQSSSEAQEGQAALFDKRKPGWQGE